MRMDAMLMGIATKEIYRNLEDVDLQIRMKGKKAGKLQIVQLTAGVTVNDLKSWLKEFQIQHNRKIDFVVVDYLDLMMPASQKISVADLFIKDKLVSEELRAMATQGQYLFCTASQLNRGAVESVDFDHSHISGGLSKIQTADNVIGIFNSPTMRERQRVQIQFMKTRSSSAVGTKLELDFNTTSLRITDIDENSDAPPTSAEVMYENLKRKAQQESTAPAPAPKQWERATGTPAWEQPPKKQEPTVGIRTMDSNSRLNSILKKS